MSIAFLLSSSFCPCHFPACVNADTLTHTHSYVIVCGTQLLPHGCKKKMGEEKKQRNEEKKKETAEQRNVAVACVMPDSNVGKSTF